MNLTNLKNFAIESRKKLMHFVADKIAFVLAPESAARRSTPDTVKKLEEAITKQGKMQVIEATAYMWFNRFCALRFMDANHYTSIGVVTPADGATRPEILAEAVAGNFDLSVNDEQKRRVQALLNGETPSNDRFNDAYRILFIASCNAWAELMPFMFEKLNDYTELLMPDDLLSANSILAELREAIPVSDCNDVEIIGWLYQFYISEKKDEVFDGLRANKKISKEDIPAATELFTPHWIVQYLVENSLGRLWMENHPESRLIDQMSYYIGGSPTVPGRECGSPTVPGRESGSPTVPGRECGSPTVPGRDENLVSIFFEYPDISESFSNDDGDSAVEAREDVAVYYPGKSIRDDECLHVGIGENNIPHWQLESTIYHVCFRLNDSVPVAKQLEWKQERENLLGIMTHENRDLTEEEKKRLQYLYSDKIERYLDTGYGECLLRIPQVAQIVQNSLLYNNGKKYILHSWCIMPNHVHIAFQLRGQNSLSEVLHGWKSFTAHLINKYLGRQGILWQHDCYNHIIRSENEYYQQIRYIWHNSDKAGFLNWQWRWMAGNGTPSDDVPVMADGVRENSARYICEYSHPDRDGRATPAIATPEELRICDPCCGSGHMLVYAFDLLYAIYEECGYDALDIPRLILSNNLFGLELDPRAAALAAFALTMKARQKQRRFLTSRNIVQPHICLLQSVRFSDAEMEAYIDAVGKDFFTIPFFDTLPQFADADNLGSLIVPRLQDSRDVRDAIDARHISDNLFLRATHENVMRLLEMCDYLAPRYHVVVTNPPYMGSKGMNVQLKEFAEKNYPDSKADLFAMFMERCLQLTQPNAYTAMITMQSWMFLSSFEKLRKKLLAEKCITSMAHLGARAFDTIGGEVVSTTAFTMTNAYIKGYLGAYIRLVDGNSEAEKKQMFKQALN